MSAALGAVPPLDPSFGPDAKLVQNAQPMPVAVTLWAMSGNQELTLVCAMRRD